MQGRPIPPFVGFILVAEHTFTLIVHVADGILSRGVALFGERTKELDGHSVVTALIRRVRIGRRIGERYVSAGQQRKASQ